MLCATKAWMSVATITEKFRCLRAADEEEAARRGAERLSAQQPSKIMRKLLRRAAILADFITEEDREASMRVVREAKQAMHYVYDHGQKCLVEYPDYKTRLAAVTLERAYDEGLPVQRVLTAQPTMESTEEIMARLRGSPAAMAALRAARDAGAQLVLNGEAVEIEAEVKSAAQQLPGS